MYWFLIFKKYENIVILKEARDMFGIKPWDSIIVFCDKEKWIALLKDDSIEDLTDKLFSN